jgi:hypothetical protein
VKRALVTLLLVAACGGEKWLPSDETAATNAVRLEVRVEELCTADAGPCTPSMVRALTLPAICDHASMLAHHGDPVPDLGGIQCLPK